MLKKSKLLVIFFLTFCSNSFEQKQANIWYFGRYAGINFNSGTPVAILDGQLSANGPGNEGSCSISDSSGAILFYSDGMTVWNKMHQVMDNGIGLLGNYSTTQSSIIVPDPKNPNKLFYLFTVGSALCCGGSITDGLRYSKIDMCLDSSRGGIIMTEKNIKLVDTVAEKISVTRHANGVDYWILTHKFYSNEFWALHLTANGITDTVITAIGSYHTGDIGGSMGQLKISGNGQRIAIGAYNSLDILDVFDFNTSTGVVSNWLPLNKPANNHASIYGVEFSPDNSKLYASGVTTTGSMYPFLLQYDLNAGGGNLAAINASMTEIYHNTVGLTTGKGLQLGPDHKIYWVSLSDDGTLACINKPNLAGTACNYQDQSISLQGGIGGHSLPGFIANFDYSNQLSNCDSTIITNIKSKDCLIFPNPFDQYATLNFENTTNEKHTLLIYNSTGQLVRLIDNITTNNLKIERQNLTKGLYIFKLLKNNKLIMACKFIIS